MRFVISLNIDAARSLITVEDRKDHEGLLLIEEVYGFLQ